MVFPMTATSKPTKALILLAFATFLISINLRFIFSSLSVVLNEIMTQTGLSTHHASLLTTLPVLCLGVFAIPAPALARRIGLERALFVALFLITSGTLLRGSHWWLLLFFGTITAGAGIALCNVLLPGFIKRDFGPWAPAMIGLFTMGLCSGAAAAAAFTQPLRNSLGGSWQLALMSWAIPGLIAMGAWLPYAIRQHRPTKMSGTRPQRLWHDALAWQVTLFMGLQSNLAYIVLGWLAPMLRQRGLDAETAGYILGLSIIAQMFATLIIPSWAARLSRQSSLAIGMSVISYAAFFACLYLPLSTLWLWGILLGLGQGGAIALALQLIVMRTADVDTTAELSGMAQGVGYTVAASGPLIVGLLKDWTGSFYSATYLIIVIGLIQATCGYKAGRNKLVQART